MTRYLAEWYGPEVVGGAVGMEAAVADAVAAVVARLEDGAVSLRSEGVPVHLLLALLVPADEVFFALWEGTAAEDVLTACARAGLPLERLSADVYAWVGTDLIGVHDIAG